ncbi:hypothetical protein SAMN04488092_105203 [Thalassovita taeanensis]|uniref:Uncharacterized protein n=2 Tax=Thalassovita taeanensis TaxID=657014 RepID=A0A1H9EWX7_9RHOB|nr:hypothetical protein SAMN04488092_105203 [Thalassovita taeanensis]
MSRVEGTGYLEETLRNQFLEYLIDPYSADFRRVRYGSNGDQSIIFACGLVNAKNRMGAYVGFTPFFAAFAHPALNESDASIVNAGPAWERVCQLSGL